MRPYGRRIADLGNGGHVQRVVELTVPALGDPVNDPAARGELDRCRPVVGGEGIAVSEPANIAGIADELRGDDRTDSVDLSERGARCLHGDSDPPVRLLGLLVESAHVVEELEGQVVADLLDGVVGRDVGQEPFAIRNVHFLGDSARSEFGQEGVEATHDSSPMAAQVDVALGQKPQAPGSDQPVRRCAGSAPERQRQRSSGRHWDRSCWNDQWRAPGSERPRWLERRAPLRREPRAAGPVDSPSRRPTRWPTSASRKARPSARAVRPDDGWRAP